MSAFPQNCHKMWSRNRGTLQVAVNMAVLRCQPKCGHMTPEASEECSCDPGEMTLEPGL